MKAANCRKRLSALKHIAKQTNEKIPEKQKLPQSHFLMANPYIKWVSKIAEVQLFNFTRELGNVRKVERKT